MAGTRRGDSDPLSLVDESENPAYDEYAYAEGDDEVEHALDELHQWYQDAPAGDDVTGYGPRRGPYGHARRPNVSQIPTLDDSEIIHLLTQEIEKLQTLYVDAQESASAMALLRSQELTRMGVELEQYEYETVILKDEYTVATEALHDQLRTNKEYVRESHAQHATTNHLEQRIATCRSEFHARIERLCLTELTAAERAYRAEALAQAHSGNEQGGWSEAKLLRSELDEIGAFWAQEVKSWRSH